MSSKFFTWTKGDRRNAAENLRASGIVPIPAECLSIKGLDYSRTAKGSSKTKRPSPLLLDHSPELASKHSSRTNESIALHSAAVQSATSLMCVMNDMLRSPHLSAHLNAQHRSVGLVPMHGRPRSHTAPSTPLVEAPCIEPVELPGSLLAGNKSLLSLHKYMDGKVTEPFAHSGNGNAIYGATIKRPNSSPQEATYPRQSTDNLSAAQGFVQPTQPSPRSKSAGPNKPFQKLTSATMSQSNEEASASSGTYLSGGTKRPSLSVLQQGLSATSMYNGSNGTSQSGSSHKSNSDSMRQETQQCELNVTMDLEALLLEQIAMLRSSHESHIHSLKAAHEKELESQRAYIAFLETTRRKISIPPSQSSKKLLTIDTTQTGSKDGDLLSADGSVTTVHSWESSENQRRISQEAMAETEALKRKLSLCRKAVAEAGEIRRERDYLREIADRSDKRIMQLKDIVRKGKDHEKILKNAISDLEARLVTANNERIDVLEGFHEACNQVSRMLKQETALRSELDVLQNKALGSITKQRHTRTMSDVRGLANINDPHSGVLSVKQDNILHQPDVAVSAGRDKDVEIPKCLELPSSLQCTKRVDELEADLMNYKQKLALAEANCERYNSLLHNELRKQVRSAAQKSTPLFHSAEIKKEVSDNLQSVLSRAPEEDSARSHYLELEIKHCLEEIILYKLDIRGYKKDIKKAQEEAERWKFLKLERPQTPESSSSARSGCDSERRYNITSIEIHHPSQDDTTSALGIVLPQAPKTPARTQSSVTSATSAALLSTSPPVSVPPSSSTRTKIPLGSHKKLPKPPPASRSPSPRILQTPADSKLQRGETMRSLSESIISSYAQRNTPPEQQSDVVLLPRDRSSH